MAKNKKPIKPDQDYTACSVRMDKELFRAATKVAKSHEMSVSAWIRQAMKEKLNKVNM